MMKLDWLLAFCNVLFQFMLSHLHSSHKSCKVWKFFPEISRPVKVTENQCHTVESKKLNFMVLKSPTVQI